MAIMQKTRVLRRRGQRSSLGATTCTVTPAGARVCYDDSNGAGIVDPTAIANQQQQIPMLQPFETLATSASVDPTTGEPVYGVYPVIYSPPSDTSQTQPVPITTSPTSVTDALSSLLPAGFSLTSPSTWPSWIYYALAAGAAYYFFFRGGGSGGSRRRK